MFGGKHRKSTKAALETVQSLIDAFDIAGGLPEGFWEDPFVLGFLYASIQASANLAANEEMDEQDLEDLVSDVLNKLSDGYGADIVSRIERYFERQHDPAFVDGLANAAKYVYVLLGSSKYDDYDDVAQARKLAADTIARDPKSETWALEHALRYVRFFVVASDRLGVWPFDPSTDEEGVDRPRLTPKRTADTGGKPLMMKSRTSVMFALFVIVGGFAFYVLNVLWSAYFFIGLPQQEGWCLEWDWIEHYDGAIEYICTEPINDKEKSINYHNLAMIERNKYWLYSTSVTGPLLALFLFLWLPKLIGAQTVADDQYVITPDVVAIGAVGLVASFVAPWVYQYVLPAPVDWFPDFIGNYHDQQVRYFLEQLE